LLGFSTVTQCTLMDHLVLFRQFFPTGFDDFSDDLAFSGVGYLEREKHVYLPTKGGKLTIFK